MNNISFPGLNLNFEINPVAINLFGITIHWYAIFIVSAIVIAIILSKKDEGKYGIKFENILDLFVWIIPISFISARLYYIIFELDYYIANPSEIFDIRSGGLAIYGGIIGGAIALIIYCKKHKLNILDVLDYIVPFLALGQAIGRWGNFVNSEAYGTETTLPWRMGIFENGIYKEVHPTFLYESICTMGIFIFLYMIRNRRLFRGQLVLWYLTLYSFARFFIEGLRIDSLMLGDYRVSQILSVAIFVVFASLLSKKEITVRKKAKHPKNQQKTL